jgi:hypothetical protein
MKLPKTHRIKAARSLIDANTIGVPFPPQDLDLFNALCETAFSSVKRMHNPTYPKDPRHIHVLDAGVWKEFSWNKAINGKPKRPEHVVLRKAVADEMHQWRMSQPDKVCERCGGTNVITTDHVDPSFFDIAEAFIAEEGAVPLMDGPPGAGDIMADIDQEARWIAFHASRAVYQLLCRSCNASKGRRPESQMKG